MKHQNTVIKHTIVFTYHMYDTKTAHNKQHKNKTRPIQFSYYFYDVMMSH